MSGDLYKLSLKQEYYIASTKSYEVSISAHFKWQI